MKHLDLFAGIGGFALGLERAGFETVAFCEIEEYPRKVLAKHWPCITIYEDIRELTGERLRADGIVPDIISAGYPCQPDSQAGKRRGKEDDRWLWPEVHRLLREYREAGEPIRYFIGENVAGHISMGLDGVLSDLEDEGYTTRTFVIPACAIGAPHRRDRVWIVADTTDKGLQGRNAGTVSGPRTQQRPERCGEALADTSRIGMERDWTNWFQVTQTQTEAQLSGCNRAGGRATERFPESRLGGTYDGLSPWMDGSWERGIPRVSKRAQGRKDRLKGLGNAVVPQIPELIGRAIMEAHHAA